MSELRWRHPLEPHNISMRIKPQTKSIRDKSISLRKRVDKPPKNPPMKYISAHPSIFLNEQQQIMNDAFYQMLRHELHAYKSQLSTYNTPEKIMHVYEKVRFFHNKYPSYESAMLISDLISFMRRIKNLYPESDKRHILALNICSKLEHDRRILILPASASEKNMKAVFFGRKRRSRKSRKSHKRSH
jgi:hypothetical protein